MVKTKMSKSGGEITAYSEVAFRNNIAMIEYCRTSACALSGCTAGVMGLTALKGFAFYFCTVLGLWCLLLLKAGHSWEKYFVSRTHLLTNGFFGGLFTYVLFWTYPLLNNKYSFFSVWCMFINDRSIDEVIPKKMYDTGGLAPAKKEGISRGFCDEMNSAMNKLVR